MTDGMITQSPSGWWLPSVDVYFSGVVPALSDGHAPKRNGFQREHLLEAFKHVRAWEMAVDVGAHVGFWTRDMADRFMKVHAFEAASDTFRCLEMNMAEFANVDVHNVAVGPWHGSCKVCEDETRAGNTGSRFIMPRGGSVAMVALDEFSLPACDLLKVDVEGFEEQVLEGAMWTIDAHRPVIVMETDKKFARARYGTPDDGAERFLRRLGYREVAHMRPDKVFVPAKR
jgi:FkbM family methyltransferase